MDMGRKFLTTLLSLDTQGASRLGATRNNNVLNTLTHTIFYIGDFMFSFTAAKCRNDVS